MAGILERLPGDLEQQALLRVHAVSFARGDLEELRIEQVDAFEQCAVAGRHLAARSGVGIVERVHVPAVQLSDRIAAVFEQAPEGSGGLRAARKAAGKTDDGEGFPVAALRLAKALFELAHGEIGALDRRELRAVKHGTPDAR